MRIEWEIHPNEEMRSIHTDVRFANEFDFSDLPEAIKALKRQLMEIDGVAESQVSDYEVCITKGRVFSWDEITGKVEEVIARFDK